MYDKVEMSPRPPKSTLKHEWTREQGSGHAQRSEVGQLSRRFQSIQPILNLIRERRERPVNTFDVIDVQDERTNETVPRRSMLILFTKNVVLQSER